MTSAIAMKFPDLRGRLVVVTGAGRPRGIGAAICRAFADQGCRIFFTTFPTYDRRMYPGDPDHLGAEGLSEELRQRGVAVRSVEADLGQTDCADYILNRVEESMGEPTILINNAAYSVRDGFETLDA